MRHVNFVRLIIGLAALSAANPSFAQLVIQDDFNSASSTFPWTAFDGACLTAGDGTGTIPACVGLIYYKSQTQVGGTGGTLPDAAGSGALRLTNGTTPVNGNFTTHEGNFQYGYNQAGGIISNFTFPSTEGLMVTFTAISYRGDSQNGDGADGISFFLMDGAYPPYDTGAFGGSLGYDCSNRNLDPSTRPADSTERGYDGLAGAYLGLGVDEYGNFGNRADNSASGPNNGTQSPSQIGLRGAGNVSWAQLYKNYPTYFPSGFTQQLAAVQAVCKSGQLTDYSGLGKAAVTIPDYPAFLTTFTKLPAGELIATEHALTRTAATPIAYKLQITAAGLLSFSYSYNGGAYQPVMTSQNLTQLNGAPPALFRFGFAGSTGGSTNVHELMCFQASPATVSASGAGLNQQQTAKVETGSQVYFAYYNPNTWAGSLTSNNLVVDPTTNAVSIASTANWDASCVLTGVATGATCATTGAPGSTAAQAPTARTMLTYNGSTGIPFEYASLPTAMVTALTAGDVSTAGNPSPNATRLNFLRGDRTNEQNSAGTGIYRERYGVLGDIMDSSPAWVGPPSAPYTATFTDLVSTGTAGVETSYLAFKAGGAATRLNVVYVGANDGFVHGFRSGAYTSAGAYVANATYPNDGHEVLAYMPQAVEQEIHSNTAIAPATANIDFANPLYGHAYYVDASPTSGDLYYKGAWHTFLVGGLGAGGNAIYALDVTDPTTFSEGAAAAQATVITELSAATIACANVTACAQYLGKTNGTPSIRRFHNGQWGFIFGNGYGSTAGTAGIFVALFDASGAMTTYYYAASSATGNGIAYATPVDLDGDHITDYVYAGDLLGNVWKFDLTSNSPANWVVRAAPVFTTASGQPITTRLIAASVPASTGLPRLMLAFGTGQMTPLTNSGPATYATASQSLYGVWDSDMAAWNGKGSVSYATLASVMTLTPVNLELQSVLATVAAPAGGVGVAYRTVSSAPICWAGTSGCAGAAAQYGWAMTLPTTNEQVIYSPILQYGAFIVNTTIPANNSPTNCEPTTATGWTMALSMANGGAFTSSFFVNSNHQFVSYNGQPVNGVELNGTGSPSIVTTPASPVAGGPPPGTDLVTQTVSGTGAVIAVNATVAVTGTRVTWAQIR